MSRVEKTKYAIHCTIGLLLMFGIGCLPAFDPITPIGMKVVGIFLGMVYLWSTVDMIWPGLLGLVALCMSGFITMNEALAQSFGNFQTIQAIGILILMGALNQNNVCRYIGRWFVTRKIINGRPWVFTSMVFVGVYILSMLTSPATSILLFWPILYSLFKEVGYEPGDKYATIMVISVVIVSLFGFAVMPFKSVVLFLLVNFEAISGIAIDHVQYATFAVVLGSVLMFGLILIIKLIYKPDVKLLKEVKTEIFEKEKLPPMNTVQKILLGTLVIFVVGMFLPAFLPQGSAIKNFFDTITSVGVIMIIICTLCMVKIEGQPVIPFSKTMATMNWSMVCLIGTALVIGNALTDERTGIKTFLTEVFTQLVQGKSVFMITIILLVVALVATNFGNNSVTGMVLLPIVLALSLSMAFKVEVMAVLVIYIVHMASITPAACPYAAMLHSNKEWVSTKDIYKYTIGLTVYILMVVLIVGIPFANIIFG